MSKNKFIRFSARFLMAIPAGLLILSCLSVFVNPSKAWLLVPLEILFWPLVFVNLGLAIWAIFRRSSAIVIPLIALLPTLFFQGRYLRINNGNAPGNGEKPVKVVSYNVGRFRTYGKKYDARTCRDSVFSFLERTDADIICLQEFYILNSEGSAKAMLKARMNGYTPTYWTYTGKSGRFGNVILSRYPAQDKGHVEFENSANLALWADFRIKDRTVRVYNCHLESYNISPAGLTRAIFSKKDSRDEAIETTGRKVRRSIKYRSAQVDQIFQHMDNSPVESIICGDFNDSPLSYTYQKTRRGHHDSFCQAGNGLGCSFPSGMPLIRLDYVLCPKDMEAVSYDCPRIRFSDHRPVVTELQLN